jgi:hypothetical protein
MRRLRWERCIEHRADEAHAFVTDYFKGEDRRVALIAGAGFDPRSVTLCDSLAPACSDLRVLLLREQRPDPAGDLVERAERNLERFRTQVSKITIGTVEIFGPDNAVIGGRNAVRAVHSYSFESITDIVVDLSALSVGTAYPIIRYLYERLKGAHPPTNLHVFVASDPALDESIRPVAGDTVGFVHGFRGRWALDSTASAAKLWLPQLARGRNAALQRIHDFLAPHDTCPILPFPSARPRLADELVESFSSEVESAWQVDTRNLLHASDEDPLDLYRTISRIDDLRTPVFAETGGSLLILSPMGSKVLALGALLAALERDLPVAYLEAIAYEVADTAAAAKPNLVHVWLAGDVYTGVSDEA